MTDERLIASLDRLTTAIEQAVLTALDGRGAYTTQGHATSSDPYPASLPVHDEPVLAPLPPMHAPAVPSAPGVCPVHMIPWKTVPAGISKRTGKPYDAFTACPTVGCTQRPTR